MAPIASGEPREAIRTRAVGPSATLVAVALAFTAGYVDTVGFVALFGLFTSHVTGNFVLIGSELARASGSVLLKLLAFPAFIAAVVVARLVVLRRQGRQEGSFGILLWLQVALLGAFIAFGWMAEPVIDANAPLAMAAGLSGAAAMGFQNAAARLVVPTLVPTTVMTGNVTQLVIDAVDLVRGGSDGATRARAVRFVLPVSAFAAGCIGGAFAYVGVGFLALLAPVGVLLALAWAVRDVPDAASWLSPTQEAHHA